MITITTTEALAGGLLLLLVGAAACGPGPASDEPPCGDHGEAVLALPADAPVPFIPEDNPLTPAGVELGRHLFYDPRLSLNQTQSCASCHEQARAFSDGRAVAVGSTGELHPRNAMGLTNVAYLSAYTWASGSLLTLEAQAAVPIFSDMPVEQGMRGAEDLLLERLRGDPRYQALFGRAFPDSVDGFTVGNVLKAIASFERTLNSFDAPHDRFLRGDREAISESARRGRELFFSERLECFHCHQGPNLQDSLRLACRDQAEIRFHNTGLYNVGGKGAYPASDTGLFSVTGKASDMGRFRTPTLRNIAVTAPYMHDGSIATLDEVLDHYAAGGRTLEDGPNAGVGSASPLKSELLQGFQLTAEERGEVLAFLESLTDEAFLTNPRFADPWGQPCPLCE